MDLTCSLVISYFYCRPILIFLFLNKILYFLFPLVLKSNHIPSEVGNVVSKRNGVTHYRFSHALRAITIKSNNVSCEPRAIAIRSDKDFHMPRAITIKAMNFPHNVEVLCDNAKM